MKSAIALLTIVIPLTACSGVPFNLDHKTLSAVAPDVPAVSRETQKQAAAEMIGHQCPSLNTIANACLITRDEARLLKK